MAAAKTGATAKKTTVRNTSQPKQLVGGGSKTTTTKRGTATKKNTAVTTRNTAAKQTYTRNPSENTSTLIAAGFGALTVFGFDFAITKLAPETSLAIRVGAKIGAGWAVGAYGKKIPIIGKFSPYMRAGLYLFAAYDVINNWAAPYAFNALGWSTTPQLVEPAKQIKLASGELGMLYKYSDGNDYIVLNNQAALPAYA